MTFLPINSEIKNRLSPRNLTKTVMAILQKNWDDSLYNLKSSVAQYANRWLAGKYLQHFSWMRRNRQLSVCTPSCGFKPTGYGQTNRCLAFAPAAAEVLFSNKMASQSSVVLEWTVMPRQVAQKVTSRPRPSPATAPAAPISAPAGPQPARAAASEAGVPVVAPAALATSGVFFGLHPAAPRAHTAPVRCPPAAPFGRLPPVATGGLPRAVVRLRPTMGLWASQLLWWKSHPPKLVCSGIETAQNRQIVLVSQCDCSFLPNLQHDFALFTSHLNYYTRSLIVG